jgi:hypothetical protein
MTTPKSIKLPIYNIRLVVDGLESGNISSDLPKTCATKSVVDTIESIILEHACAGVDVESRAYLKGLETAIYAIFNHNVTE